MTHELSTLCAELLEQGYNYSFSDWPVLMAYRDDIDERYWQFRGEPERYPTVLAALTAKMEAKGGAR